MKSFLLIAFIPVSFAGLAQTSLARFVTSNLFWYPGTKQDQNTLTNAKGDIIKYNKKDNTIRFVIKKEDEVVKSVRKKMPASKKQKEFLIKTSIDKKGPAYYSLTQQMVDEHESIDKAYESVTSDKISLTDPFQSAGEGTNRTSPLQVPTPDWIKIRHKEIMDYAKFIEVNTSFNLPKPAEFDFACNLCEKDSTVRKKSASTRKEYSEEIFQKENEAIKNIITIERAYSLDLGEPTHMKGMMKELHQARSVIFRRVKAKCSKLLEENAHDLEALITIIPVVLQKERERQLIDAGNDNGDNSIMVKAAELFTERSIHNFIEKKLDAKDFKYIINPAPLISLIRQSLLLGGMEENQYQDLISKIIDNNRFELQSTMEIKRTYSGKEGNTFLQAVFVSEPFYYMVAETPDCKLVLVPDTGFQTVYSKNRLMTYDIKSMRHTECTYSGPVQLQIPSPIIHLDFCADTAQLEFSFAMDWAGNEEKWSCSYGSDGDLISNLLSEGYNNRVDDTNSQMDELINNNTQEGLEQMVAGKEPVINNLEEMKKHYPKSIETAQKSFDFRQFIKTVPLSNFQSLLIQEKLNGKETHDADDERFEYSWLKIRLEHAPRIH
ncbi:MAG TPA: hypothetical protein VM012_04250 [Flavitalea sp.]|nr:hypothetical protein [Flavitalea sp.]